MAEDVDLESAAGRLRWARAKAGYSSAADFARVVRVDPTTYRAYENGQNGFARRAPDFAAKLGVASDWLMRGGPAPTVAYSADVRSDVRSAGMSPQEARAAWSMVNAKPVPLLGTAFGAEWTDDAEIETTMVHLNDVQGQLARPPSLADDDQAYAVEIVGDSMAPRYEPQEQVFVSPRAQVRIGDDVIVQIRGTGRDQLADQVVLVLIKRLTRRTSSFVELRQFNPEKTFRVPNERIARIHRVKGRL